MKSEKGITVLMALFAAVLLTLLGLSMTFTSISEYSMSNEFENHERALAIADAGFYTVKSALRGNDLSTKLAATTVVPRYLSYTDPAPGTYGYRNPLFPLEARNVDFEYPPAAYGSRTDKGFLTSASGVVLGTGRYFAKMCDNRDETPFGLPENYEVDRDATVYLRVMGTHRGAAPSEQAAYGGTIKNSVAIIEAMVKRDMSFNIGSPFAVYGPNVNPANNNFFDGNSFTVDGFDHSGWNNADITKPHTHPGGAGQAAVGVLYDNPAGGDATTSLNTIYNGLNPNGTQYDNLEGAPGPWGPNPSLQDDTNDVRNSPYADATNIFNAYFLANFINMVTAIADYRYPDGTTLSGSNILLGTEANPKITVAEGDLSISGNGSGAGILIVKGKLNYQGSFDYSGVVLVIGEGSAEFGGANKSLIGGIFIANLINNNGQYSFGVPSFTLGGNSNFYFKSESVRLALSLFPLKTIMWREITPEIEPVE